MNDNFGAPTTPGTPEYTQPGQPGATMNTNPTDSSWSDKGGQQTYASYRGGDYGGGLAPSGLGLIASVVNLVMKFVRGVVLLGVAYLAFKLVAFLLREFSSAW